jgi:uncharacterized protein YecT (DUF1311 family)
MHDTLRVAPEPESETLKAIFEAQREEDLAELAVEAAKTALKEAKEAYLDARDRRVSLVRHADQGRLQFGEAG